MKCIPYQVASLVFSLVWLSADPLMGQSGSIDNIVATPDSAEPWIYSIKGTATLPESNDYKYVVIYTQSSSGGKIQLPNQTINNNAQSPTMQVQRIPRAAGLNALNYNREKKQYEWQLDNIWLGDSVNNTWTRYFLYIFVIIVDDPDELSRLMDTHDKYIDTTRLLRAIEGLRFNQFIPKSHVVKK